MLSGPDRTCRRSGASPQGLEVRRRLLRDQRTKATSQITDDSLGDPRSSRNLRRTSSAPSRPSRGRRRGHGSSSGVLAWQEFFARSEPFSAQEQAAGLFGELTCSPTWSIPATWRAGGGPRTGPAQIRLQDFQFADRRRRGQDLPRRGCRPDEDQLRASAGARRGQPTSTWPMSRSTSGRTAPADASRPDR